MELLSLFQVASQCCVTQCIHLLWIEVGCYRYNSLSTHCDKEEAQVVVAGEHCECVWLCSNQVHHLVHVAACFLYSLDVWMLCQAEHCSVVDVLSCSSRDVIYNHWNINCVCDSHKVAVEALHAGLVVVWCNLQCGIYSIACCNLGHVQSLGCAVGACACDNLAAACSLSCYKLDNLKVILVDNCRALACCTHRCNSGNSGLHLEIHQRLECAPVD